MLKFLTPHLQLASVLEITPAVLGRMGITGLLLDLDCTLLDYRGDACRAEVLEWIRQTAGARIRMCILSNGRSGRVGPVARSMGIPCVAFAAKPLTRRLGAALQVLDLERARVAIVGDQIFSDVLAGRLAGIATILVRPTTAHEAWITRIKRPLERMVLSALAKREARVKSLVDRRG